MKKLLVVLIVLAFVAPAMAADNFVIKGQYYVTGWDTENFADGDDNNNGDDTAFWFHRMRVQPMIKVADGITAIMRLDFAEGTWGSANNNNVRPNFASTDNLQVDRAYVDIKQGMWRLRAGRQFVGLGQNQVFRDNNNAIQFDIKTPVTFRVGYVKASEQGVTDETGSEDIDRYIAAVGFKNDKFSVNGFYAMQKDDTPAEAEPNVFGVYAKTKIGMVAVKGELAVFGGDNAAGTDFVGTQFNAEAIAKISDMISVGAELIYSDGVAATANESKLTRVGQPFARKSLITGGGLFGDYYGGNWTGSSGQSGTPLGGDGVFNPLDDSTVAGSPGAVGGGLGLKISPMDKLTFLAYLHYLTADEDIPGEYDSILAYQGVVQFNLAPKTKLQAAYLAVDADAQTGTDPDTATSMWLNLTVNF